MKKTLYIIGGGLAGISQAIKNQKSYEKICIIEGSQGIGGLLKSICVNNNHYPIGAHFLRKTNIGEIDEILYPDIANEWTVLPYLKNGTTSYKRLDTGTGFLNIRYAPIRVKINLYMVLIYNFIKHLVRATAENHNESNEYDYLRSRFGKCIAKEFNELSVKYYGISLKKQSRGSLVSIVCTDRVKAFSKALTLNLKKLSYFDNILSYHDSKTGSIENSNFVPNSLNYTKWWSDVLKRLKSNGIQVITSAKVEKIHNKKLFVKSTNHKQDDFCINLADEDDIIDTIRVGKGSSVKISETILLFLESSVKPSIESYFVTSYSKEDVFSRITFCANIGGKHNGIVVEIIKPIGRILEPEKAAHEVEIQVKNYGMIEKNAVLKLVKCINLKTNGFQPTLITDKNINYDTIGKAGGSKWFMDEIING